MKKDILTFAFLITMFLGSLVVQSCGHQPAAAQCKIADTAKSYDVDGLQVSEVTIDGCEYLASGKYGFSALTHKGNCKNPCHIVRDTIYWNPITEHSKIP